MASKNYLVSLNLNKNELQNAKLGNATTSPSLLTTDEGFTYWNTTDHTAYFWTGSTWKTLEASNYIHPVGDGFLHVIATGTTNNGKVLTAGATAGSLSWTTPTVGTVTNVSVTTNAGVSGVVANSTTTPAITLTLGDITPTSTNGVSAITMAYNDATSSIQTQLNGKLSSGTSIVNTFNTRSGNVVLSSADVTTALGYTPVPDSRTINSIALTSDIILNPDNLDDTATVHKFISASERTTWNAKQDALVSGTNIKTINSNNLLGAGNITVATLIGFTPENVATKNQPNGYAGLDGNSKINPLQLPALAITDTFVVANQAEMLALTLAEVGDIAVRTDINKSFILKTTGYATLANWQELLSPTDVVTHVFGRVGDVTAQSGDYNSDQIEDNLYLHKFVSAGDIINWNGKANLDSPAFTGIPTAATATAGTNTTQLATTAFVKSQNYSTTTGTTNKVYATIGDGSTTVISVLHSLPSGTEVIAQARFAVATYNSNPVTINAIVDCDIVILDATHVTFGFAIAPALNSIKVVIIG